MNFVFWPSTSRSSSAHALDDVRVGRRRLPRHVRIRLQVRRLDDERVAFPMRDRVAHRGGQHRLGRVVVRHVDLPVHAVAFPVDREVLRPLLDLDRERRAPDGARHAGPLAVAAGVVVERERFLVLRERGRCGRRVLGALRVLLPPGRETRAR